MYYLKEIDNAYTINGVQLFQVLCYNLNDDRGVFMKNLTVKEANELILDGNVVGIPTETVYGLAANARSDVAVSKIFEAKGRPSDNPLIVHIGDISQVDNLVTKVSPKARLLMDYFWPGALTIILPSSGVVSHLVTAGLTTVGLRMPSHEIALELLRLSGVPLAAPSANRSGKPSPTCAKHVMHDMKGRIAGVVDGGISDVGLESTVIDMTTDVPVILRPGGVSKEAIESVIGCVDISDNNGHKPKSPGMKYVHYAPNANIYIVKGGSIYFEKTVERFKEDGLKIGVLCLDHARKKYALAGVVKVIGIGEKGKNLYAALREFDRQDVDIILSESFDDEAVMNRLMKASEERILSEVEN